MNKDYSNTDREFLQDSHDDGLVMESTSPTSWENPAEGPHEAILAEVRDLGMRPTSFGMKRKLRLVWKITDQPGSDGRTIRAFQTFTASWHARSHLRRNARAILGYEPGDRYDLKSLVGSRAVLHIEHNRVGDKTYANVTAVTRPIGGGQ